MDWGEEKKNIHANCELTFIWSLNIYTFSNIYFGDIHSSQFANKHTHIHFDENEQQLWRRTMLLVEPAALNWTPLLKRLKFLHIKNGV